MGLIKAPQGEIKENSEILYNGENILKYNKKQWQHYKGGECAIIFQDALASLNPTMRVGKQIMENLMGHKNMTKQEAAKEAVEMLRMVGHPGSGKTCQTVSARIFRRYASACYDRDCILL